MQAPASMQPWQQPMSWAVLPLSGWILSEQRIQFAKTKSDAVAKVDGTFVPRDKKKKKGTHVTRTPLHKHITRLTLLHTSSTPYRASRTFFSYRVTSMSPHSGTPYRSATMCLNSTQLCLNFTHVLYSESVTRPP